jgi:hypothetical protein
MKHLLLIATLLLLAPSTQAQQPKDAPPKVDPQITVTLTPEQSARVDEIERQIREVQKTFEVLVLRRRVVLLESGVSKELIDALDTGGATRDGQKVEKKP